MRGRHRLAGLAARRRADERARPVERVGRDPEPHDATRGCARSAPSTRSTTVENGAARTCSAGNVARTTKPGEHVPRIPIVSQVPVCSSSVWSARREHHHLIAGLGVGRAAQRS